MGDIHTIYLGVVDVVFVLLGLALVSLVYGIATREGGVEFWPNPFF